MYYFLLVNDLVPVSAALQGTLQLGDTSPAGLSSSEPLPGSSGSSKRMGRKGASPTSAGR